MVFTTNEYTELWMCVAYLSGNTSQRYNSHTCTIQYLARFGKGMNSGSGAPEVSRCHLFDIMYVPLLQSSTNPTTKQDIEPSPTITIPPKTLSDTKFDTRRAKTALHTDHPSY